MSRQYYVVQWAGREEAFDDKERREKRGIYRVKFLDKQDLDKKGNPKVKFKYYYLKTDNPVTPEDQVRIDKLGIAPAYENVWVSDNPDSKIQATGIDEKGRKQYRYHSNHINNSTNEKFLRLYKFIHAIPKLEAIMDKDLEKPDYQKDKTIAIMLNVVKELNMRVGKECYAKTNKSYGVSSLKKSHVKIDDDKKRAKFNFKAKSNKQVQYTLTDGTIVPMIAALMDLEGEKLFQYRSDAGNIVRVTDTDLNQYIQKHMGNGFSVKDFRTYAANFYFIKALLKETKERPPDTQKAAAANLNKAQEHTAFYLRHTKAISKKSYTMDLIRNTYMKNPGFFIENGNKRPITVLIQLLEMFADQIKADGKKAGEKRGHGKKAREK